jgi:hypothetical protein
MRRPALVLSAAIVDDGTTSREAHDAQRSCTFSSNHRKPEGQP